ncbi:unnamed protein product [Heligmosomoides polygyrus]|uniref:Uncharacterized protein n=1 Tax=Heligmosomoides polygyrus TaxID=6339 RepID=A0A3P8EBC3_HELPZ|nr:unnamed protein product [Heligmosomoides polygyrus]
MLPTMSGNNCRRPWPPVNLLADFAGGGLTAAFGIVAALLKREKNGGHGCIIDCSMADGLSYLGSFVRRYQDIEHLWSLPYAAFSGDCPVYRFCWNWFKNIKYIIYDEKRRLFTLGVRYTNT